MKTKCLMTTLSALVFVIASGACGAAEKITISYSSRTYAFLPAQVAVARGSYDLILPSFSPDGGTVDKTYEFAVDARRSTLKTDKVIPLSQVRDTSLLREVQKELRL